MDASRPAARLGSFDTASRLASRVKCDHSDSPCVCGWHVPDNVQFFRLIAEIATRNLLPRKETRASPGFTVIRCYVGGGIKGNCQRGGLAGAAAQKGSIAR